jgi:hypothetical protein
MGSFYRTALSALARSGAVCVLLALPSNAAQKICQRPDSQSAPAPVSSKADRPISDKWAVVVGLSKFNDPSIQCQFGAKDAQDFADYLVRDAHFASDHVHTLLDAAASREKILVEFGEFLPRVTTPDDLVVVFISTNGSAKSQDKGEFNYLVAHDTDKNNLFGSGIAMQELANMIKQRINADRLVLIVDSSYSGAAIGAKGLFRTTSDPPFSGPIILVSSSTDQNSWDSTRYANSIFTRCLIDSLHKNQNFCGAFNYLRNQVQMEVMMDHHGTRQTPILRNGFGDVILSEPATSPRPAPKTGSTKTSGKTQTGSGSTTLRQTLQKKSE